MIAAITPLQPLTLRVASIDGPWVTLEWDINPQYEQSLPSRPSRRRNPNVHVHVRGTRQSYFVPLLQRRHKFRLSTPGAYALCATINYRTVEVPVRITDQAFADEPRNWPLTRWLAGLSWSPPTDNPELIRRRAWFAPLNLALVPLLWLFSLIVAILGLFLGLRNLNPAPLLHPRRALPTLVIEDAGSSVWFYRLSRQGIAGPPVPYPQLFVVGALSPPVLTFCIALTAALNADAQDWVIAGILYAGMIIIGTIGQCLLHRLDRKPGPPQALW